MTRKHDKTTVQEASEGVKALFIIGYTLSTAAVILGFMYLWDRYYEAIAAAVESVLPDLTMPIWLGLIFLAGLVLMGGAFAVEKY